MLQIDLYTEIACPWCIIGQHRLDKVLKERFPDLAVDIRHHPVLLMPDTAVSGRDLSGVRTQAEDWLAAHGLELPADSAEARRML